MTVAMPPILTRAAFVDARGVLTRDAVLLLASMRGAVGGDGAPVAPGALDQLSPVSALATAADALGPVAVSLPAADALGPVSIFTAAGDLAPVGGA